MVGPVACNAPLFSRAALQYPGNPYDGHTLKSALQQASKILGFELEMAICDLGYRGHNYEGRCDVQIVNRFRKRASRSLRRWWNRRSAIESVIGHCKSEHRMDRNQLRGSLGDEVNVIFAAAGTRAENPQKRANHEAGALFCLTKFIPRLFYEYRGVPTSSGD